MRWEERRRQTSGKSPNRIERIIWVLSKLEPHLVSTVSQTPILSNDEKEGLVKDFREVKERLIDGYSRLQKTVVREGFPDSMIWNLDDTSLMVKLDRTEKDLQYFVSLGLHTLEKLYLSNHLSEELYFKYRRILRFLPKFHTELVKRLESGRRKGTR